MPVLKMHDCDCALIPESENTSLIVDPVPPEMVFHFALGATAVVTEQEDVFCLKS